MKTLTLTDEEFNEHKIKTLTLTDEKFNKLLEIGKNLNDIYSLYKLSKLQIDEAIKRGLNLRDLSLYQNLNDEQTKKLRELLK